MLPPLYPAASAPLDTQPAIPLTPSVTSSGPGTTKMRSRRVAPRVNSHPYLFTLMTLTAMAELGLTAFLICAGNEIHTWASPGYYSLLVLLCFEATWTLVFSGAYVLWVVDGAMHVLANVASSVIWLLLTAVLWGAGAGLMHGSRVDVNCPDLVPISQCRQTVTVEALGWTEFALCCITLIATLLWLRTGWRKSFVRDSRTFV
ncbi:hypothetical protein B0H21DRAFT_391650 [Amylocystis lapponica]|nr:hypothetical protein B0H21DRAFT_391650 [Amylocystis lapponica]